jgi:hypothetical protein
MNPHRKRQERLAASGRLFVTVNQLSLLVTLLEAGPFPCSSEWAKATQGRRIAYAVRGTTRRVRFQATRSYENLLKSLRRIPGMWVRRDRRGRNLYPMLTRRGRRIAAGRLEIHLIAHNRLRNSSSSHPAFGNALPLDMSPVVSATRSRFPAGLTGHPASPVLTTSESPASDT